MQPRFLVADVNGLKAQDRLLNCFNSIGYIILQDELPPTLSKFILSESNKLFSETHIDKTAYVASEADAPGFMPFGAAKAIDTGVPNLLESWTILPGRLEKFPTEFYDLFLKVNELSQLFLDKAKSVLTLLERAFKIGGVLRAYCDPGRSSCHIINYPSWLISNGSNARRQSVHKDSSLLTLLKHHPQALW